MDTGLAPQALLRLFQTLELHPGDAGAGSALSSGFRVRSGAGGVRGGLWLGFWGAEELGQGLFFLDTHRFIPSFNYGCVGYSPLSSLLQSQGLLCTSKVSALLLFTYLLYYNYI